MAALRALRSVRVHELVALGSLLSADGLVWVLGCRNAAAFSSRSWKSPCRGIARRCPHFDVFETMPYGIDGRLIFRLPVLFQWRQQGTFLG
jgi:hypothetical protein